MFDFWLDSSVRVKIFERGCGSISLTSSELFTKTLDVKIHLPLNGKFPVDVTEYGQNFISNLEQYVPSVKTVKIYKYFVHVDFNRQHEDYLKSPIKVEQSVLSLLRDTSVGML